MALIISKGSGRRTINPSEFDSEQELRDTLANNPSLLAVDGEHPLALVKVEVELPQAGRLDILLVDSTGYPVAVEVKLKRNIQSRREVVAQAFDYTSDLSQLTSDELDARTGESLATALLSFDAQPNNDRFEARWRSCGMNLRAGKVRLVVAVDSATEDLIRIVQYINDHSDLDVRLIEVHKYKDGDECIFVPNTVVHGGLKDLPGSSDSRQKEVLSEELSAVVREFDAMVDPELRQRKVPGKPITWQRMRLNHWPDGLHYQFIDHADAIGLEIHLEDRQVKALGATLKEFIPMLQKQFPHLTIQFDPRWFRYSGRLQVLVPRVADPKTIAGIMKRLIELTRKDLDEALQRLPEGGDNRTTTPISPSPASVLPVAAPIRPGKLVSQ